MQARTCPEARVILARAAWGPGDPLWVVQGCGRNLVLLSLPDHRVEVVDEVAELDVFSDHVWVVARSFDAIPTLGELLLPTEPAPAPWRRLWSPPNPLASREQVVEWLALRVADGPEPVPALAPEQISIRTWENDEGVRFLCMRITDDAGTPNYYECAARTAEGEPIPSAAHCGYGWDRAAPLVVHASTP